MILTLDVGNSHIYGGVFECDKLRTTFRKKTAHGSSSDEMGLFLRSVLRENGVDPGGIQRVAVCSVVPDLVHSLKNCCLKYFRGAPFILQPGVKTGLKIKYRNPLEVGSDRIATAIAATHLYPGKNLIVIDFGTATTFCAITADKDYLGGVIVAGLRISMEALESKTARLPSVEIVVPEAAIGRSTIESIQSGLYYGAIGMVKEITSRISKEAFSGEKPVIIGTGGFASLLDRAEVFDLELPNLVLKGIYLAAQMNA
ncbi:type III pantothenate kinase [Bdellovibrionota bacterium FG-2]